MLFSPDKRARICPSCGERVTSLIAGCALCGYGRNSRERAERAGPSPVHRPWALSRLAWRLVHRA
ncbi:MAG: hypothetical protein JOZ07_08550 [Solirubrobacterales bacterium]|nr:hypothetical protein [Solirubrobacterales bacterium]